VARGRGKDLVAALAVAVALVHGGTILLRARGVLGAHWTDGERRLASETGDLVRHAVWDEPEVLAQVGAARDPALTPDGRFLVFVTGERRLNAELYIAELVDGTFARVEPIAELNTASDELAPAFAEGALWFASDRPGGAGGLDLWRASYTDGRFGPAELVGPGLNSAADDTDPAPLRSGAVVFASDRLRPRGDLDLYEAELSGDLFEAQPLVALDTPFQEREPCAGPDDRVLYFASDRDGNGEFDLWRSLSDESGWLAPVPVRALNGAGTERGPCASADGFALLFEGRSPAGEPELLRARSRELYRLPAGPASLAEWLFLAGLVLLALVALLAKRWHALDIVYKCLLVSLIVHLLLLLYLRTVYPEGARFGGQGEGDRTYRVRLAPEQGVRTPSGLQARLGAGAAEAPERERLASVTTAAPAPEVAQLTAPERPVEDAPGRAALAANASPSEAAPVALHEREAPLERLSTSAAGLALRSRSAGERSAEPVSAAPARGDTSASSTVSAIAPRPGASSLSAPDAASADVARGGPAPATAVRASAPEGSAEIAVPGERFERSGGAAHSLEITGHAYEAHVVASAGALERTVPGAPATGSDSGTATPAPVASILEPVDTGTGAAPARGALAAAPSTNASLPDSAVRQPVGEVAQRASTPAAAFDATAGLAGDVGGERATLANAGGPQRGEVRGAQSVTAVHANPAPVALEAPSGDAELSSSPVPRRASAPAVASSSSAELDLRAPHAEPREAAAEARPAAAAFDALGGLSDTPSPAPAPATAPTRAPERPRLGTPVPALAAQPESHPIDAPRSEALTADTEPPRARITGTPYQNRFGAPKLRALEEFGGSEGTEHAVAMGLSYLASIQNENGCWGQRSDAHEKYLDVRIGKTGLALLAFLGAGHVPGGSTEYAATSARAVRYLLDAQDRETGHFGRSCSYGHGIATYALAECYALTQAADLRAALERAVAEILRNQHAERDPRWYGGWGYYFADGHVWNNDAWPRTSITAWQVMALESARLGGLDVPDDVFQTAREFLQQAWDERAGAFRYSHDPARLRSGYPILPASTPAGLFALGLLGVDPAAGDLAPARRFVLARLPDGYRYTGNDDFVEHARGNLYFWYYATLALFRVGGTPWETWNEALKATLLPAQQEDGSWEPLDIYSEYAGDDDEERTYTTALCVLSLEIYYRYFTPLLRVK